ncbi:MAG: hypothetical protein K9L82_09995 [Chromatiaceae bacterium]|nr:hypothetical protein [Chromatiaceae bacterium]MCF7995453.1 hypothetical protein [Chromatiaceae bacterium]MCF8017189.1 hypothetical protein [Chromatiaceae bacterium]
MQNLTVQQRLLIAFALVLLILLVPISVAYTGLDAIEQQLAQYETLHEAQHEAQPNDSAQANTARQSLPSAGSAGSAGLASSPLESIEQIKRFVLFSAIMASVLAVLLALITSRALSAALTPPADAPRHPR